ncbi:hypothetical protein HKB23_12765 [Vibrio parahaemolyticus]|nr:hypothetical protein [Vibrio parahaemolyticus]
MRTIIKQLINDAVDGFSWLRVDLMKNVHRQCGLGINQFRSQKVASALSLSNRSDYVGADCGG